MKIYQSLPQIMDAGQSVTIESAADGDGYLLEPISDRDLCVALQSLQHATIDKAFWTHGPDCSELGLYTVRFMTRVDGDGHRMFDLKVWVVPEEPLS